MPLPRICVSVATASLGISQRSSDGTAWRVCLVRRILLSGEQCQQSSDVAFTQVVSPDEPGVSEHSVFAGPAAPDFRLRAQTLRIAAA
jgi:hypothetical protein